MTDAPILWRDLRRFTPARIALGRVGNGLPTTAHLAFQAAHAAARDAVHTALDIPTLQADLTTAGLDSLVVRSACPDRRTYLLRPDLGRRLHPDDQPTLAAHAQPGSIAIAICDGLSACAVQRHAPPLLARLTRHLGPTPPIIIATQGRVALGDDIGAALAADAIIVLIGERPGLSTPDSMGAYLTWQPGRGRTDANRNCVSNIRPEGLSIPQAAAKLEWLIHQMRHLKLSGVALKDEQPRVAGGDGGSVGEGRK
jgi:ethanolamine ammonia-lyase small subunit